MAACHAFTGVTEHTDSWTPGKPITELNATTDKGLAVSTFGSDGKYKQADGYQNSATYMGRNGYGQILVVDQWPGRRNALHNAPFKHTLIDYGPKGLDSKGNYHSRVNNAYYYHVIVVK